MSSPIYTYALIKALYDERRDYIDSFWPFAVRAIPLGKSVNIGAVQNNLRGVFNLEVPLHVLQLILIRAEKGNYIESEVNRTTGAKKYKLTDAGRDYSAKLETDKEVDRRINALLQSMKGFFESKGLRLSFDQIRESLLNFLHTNIDYLVEWINPSVKFNSSVSPQTEHLDKYLLEYIESADQREPDNYRTLENMVMGSIISALLYVEKPDDITNIRATRFGKCRFFLDTNFVFSVLDLHVKEFNDPAKELLNLLKKHGFNLIVFSFTLDEMSRVLNSYQTEYHRYPTNVYVNTLHSALKRKGWTKTDVREFIINLERTLREHGIFIKWVKGINLRDYKPEEILATAIRKYKPDQSTFNRNHDLVAIAKIAKLRGKAIRRIEDAKAIFLTSDIRLSRFNLDEMEHRENGTVCEAVLDSLITNILWLKNPNTKPPLKSIIAAHSRDLFVNRRVWDRFYKVLQELKLQGKVKDEEISTLFWHSYVEDILRPIEETEVDKITPQFVLDEIEKAAKQREEVTERRIKEIGQAKEIEMKIELQKKEREFEEHLVQSTSEAESKRDSEWLDKIGKIKQSLREHSEIKAGKWSNVLTLAITLIFIAALIVTYFTIPYDILSLILTVVGGGGFIALWTKGRGRLRNIVFERVYQQRIKEAKLDQIH